MTNVTYKIEQNAAYGDFRVVKYLDGIWINERDGNWSKHKAARKAIQYRSLSKRGLPTMGDNV